MALFKGIGNGDQTPPLPRIAAVPLPMSEPPVPVTMSPEKYMPRRLQHQDDHHDREAMARATQAYDALQRQLEQAREKLDKQSEEIGHQRARIDLLEAALSHAKNEAVEYRTQADEAKAQTASWKVFFANIKSIFNQYDLPDGAPKKIDVSDQPKLIDDGFGNDA
jgi:hypothetical protein